MARILLVEDNEGICEGLKYAFEDTPHQLLIAENMKEARAAFLEGSPELVLLDVNLPDGDGFELYRQYFAPRQVPTIFLTARGEENDIVKGLELGAEDYICKPFSTRELMARVNRVLLRHTRSSVIKVGEISYDLDRMKILRNREEIKLSSLELKIFHLLMEKAGSVVNRNEVIDCIWEATGNDVYDHTVTVYIKRLREKLGVDIISTVKGIGYRIDIDNQG